MGGSGGVVAAAGGLVWRRRSAVGEAVELLVIHRPHRDDWSFPKGKLDPGETAIEAALREVREETGYRCEAGIHLGSVFYRDGADRAKTVQYWMMQPLGEPAAHDGEVDELRWSSLAAVAALLSYDTDRLVLGRFVERLSAG